MPTSFRDITSIPVNPFGVTFYVSNITNPTEEQGSPGTTRQGRTPKNPFTTIQRAIDEAVSGRGDTIIVQRGGYTENLVINKVGLSLLGAVMYGYPDHVIVTGTAFVQANGVSAYNLEFFSNSTLNPSVAVGVGGTVAAPSLSGFEANGSWFEHCSFASDGTTEPAQGLIIFGGNNHVVKENRFVDNTRALVLMAGADSVISGVRVLDNEFVENTTYHLGNTGMGGLRYGLGTGFGILNVCIQDNAFNRGEVTPTDYVNIAGTSSGIMTGNRFALATNAAADIVIPAGILYSGNYTEAGVTTARPA